MDSYQRRVVDGEIDELFGELAALSLEGAKAVGKTATASRRARTVYRLDDEAQRSVIEADQQRVVEGERPILIDEWQRLPAAWDLVRREVDQPETEPGSFLLTGSATTRAATHSGAGRIVTLRMRPMTLVERGVTTAAVSVSELLRGTMPRIRGTSAFRLDDYVTEILASGFPGLRGLSERARRAQLDGYVERIVEHDFRQLGFVVRNAGALRRWLTAYAAATSTTASYETIRDAATSGEGNKPAKSTVGPYRDALEQLWIIDPVPAWSPTRNRLSRLSSPPKHQLVDAALAARLLGAGADALVAPDETPPAATLIPRDGTLLGALFESLVTNDLRVYAQAAEARVGHLRTMAGEREVDLILERGDGRIVAVEVKLAATVGDRDVRHLHWLRQQLGGDVLDAIVVTTGAAAFRRADGIAVVPAALLGP